MLNRMLARLPRVTAPLQQLGSHVAAFLNGVERRLSSGSIGAHSPRVTFKIGSRKKRLTPSEARLLTAFEESTEIEAVDVEPHLDGDLRFRPDFALWLSGARGQLPRPVIVELLGQGTVQRKLDHLDEYAMDSRIGAIMLIDELEALPLTLVRRMPMIYQIGISNFEMLLQDARLVPEMVRASALQHVLKANAQIR